MGSLALLEPSNDCFPIRFFSAARCWVGRHKRYGPNEQRGSSTRFFCRRDLYQFVKVLGERPTGQGWASTRRIVRIHLSKMHGKGQYLSHAKLWISELERGVVGNAEYETTFDVFNSYLK